MKRVFRFLDGTLNGFYLKNIHHCLHEFAQSFVSLFAYHASFVLKMDEDVLEGETSIEEKDIKNLGVFAGVFPPYISSESNKGSILFTPSFIVNGKEYSERALRDRIYEVFRFYRTNQGVYTDDIVTLSSPQLQASFVPSGTPILGYIPDDVSMFTSDGQIIHENILDEPPEGKAWYPYYGDNFLFLAETFLIEAYIAKDTFMDLFFSYQRIRYNGASFKEFVFLTNLIMGDYIKDVYVETFPNRVIFFYSFNELAPLQNKVRRAFIWKYIIETKFKQVVLEEVTP